MIGWAQTIARRLLDLDLETDRERAARRAINCDLLLVGQAVIQTSRRLTRLEGQLVDLRSRQDEFDLTPHKAER